MDEQFIMPLRQDLLYREIEENGEKYFTLIDPKGYVSQQVIMPLPALPLLLLAKKKLTKDELYSAIVKETTDAIDIEPIYQLFEYLDFAGYLDSPRFQFIKEDVDSYINSPIRPPVCAGSSYSDDIEILTGELTDIINSYTGDGIAPDSKGIIVPHIDFRIGEGAYKTYSAGYQSIKNSEADLIVIFGTAHYGFTDLFMFTEKDFQTPLGIAETDKELLHELKIRLPFDMTFDDMTHRHEHSIELQTVLLQHVFKGRNFKILPVLCGSFQKFINEKQSPSEAQKYKLVLEKLEEAINHLGRKPLFIASADMAHIGRKFGDDFDAETELTSLAEEDKILLSSLEKCEPEEFYTTISNVEDKRRICGLSPIYSLLQILKPQTGKFLNYHQWNEAETKSAVSFASVAYYK
ncbi:MAG: AmmeMemoRadiSam system protein B [FCB group bacterium]|jgi:AmmeMemoRadiSam system protein B